MRTWMLAFSIVALCLAATPTTHAEPDTTATPDTIELTYKVYRSWKFELPAERFDAVGATLDFRKGRGKTFATKLQGDALQIDRDADGALDVVIGGKSGFVVLSDGDFRYAARLVNNGAGWRYAAGGAMVGYVDGTPIRVIDQNNDGRYGDVGEDAVIIGHGRSAAFLSSVINVEGKLYDVDVASNGTTMSLHPHKGETGVLDLRSKHATEAKLQSAVVRSTDGRYSFELARAKDGLEVPVATYDIHGGKLGLGQNVVRFRQGRSKPLEVGKGKTVAVEWGGPLRAEFAIQRGAGEIGIDPGRLRYFGRAGEEYFGWAPFGKSPEFTIAKKGTSEEIAKAIFTGC